MKNKLIIVVLISIVSFSGMLYQSPDKVYAIEINSETVMPMSDVLVWKYKTVNNVLYKRLYNASKKKWVGNWIRC